MKQEDQRIKLTKMMVKQAYAELLKTTPADKISISLLCEQAQINRGTFYSHYKDIFDLKTKIKSEFVDELKKQIVPFVLKTKKDQITSVSFFHQILDFVKNNANAAYIVVVTKDEDDFLNEVIYGAREVVELAYPGVFKNKDSLDIQIYFEFVSGGAISIIANWIKGGCLIPVDILATRINNLIESASAYLTI